DPSEETMPDYTYLIVGGGMTGEAALQGIREVDRDGSIGVIGAEPHRPYDRPPLSKGLWKGKPLESIWRTSDVQNVTFHFGRTARHLDPQAKRVTDDQGTAYTFSKLLLATGCTPRRLPFGGEQIIYFRTLDDYQRLRGLTEKGQRFAVIGGGFIGSEIAAALTMNGKQVVMIFPENAIGSRAFPADLARSVNEVYRQKGVEVLAGESVDGLETRDGKPLLKIHNAQTKSGRDIKVDGVVAGIGVVPNIELAKEAGLEVENGIRVDASLRTSRASIYAAGDVASFHNPALDKWLRVEHEDNANTMGALAGHAMAGEVVSYDHLPSFYSDLFELGYEAVGEIDSRLETVADWKEPYREGVVYYLRDGRVRGVLLWNVWDQVDSARKLIAETGPFHAEDLRGRLPA
ncbi:MAG TPA: FAD/NAD(P)-binding oxidoreductase, partial [Lacipirellulaceae bacterium]|nr:FAD/NAD(P)-binding oxidoreductase [Lacipirellulaceae bacterium]